MSEEGNQGKLIGCFVEALGISKENVVDSLAYQEIPEWDSTAHMSLVFVLEDVFEIVLDTEDIIAMNSVAAARRILEEKQILF